MHRLFGLVLAGGIVLGYATDSQAQFSLSIGNPYSGGFSIGTPYYYPSYGYSYGYPYGGAYGPSAYGATGYSSYYAAPGIGYAAPLVGTTTYSSGYSGYVAPGTTSFYSGVVSPVVPFYRSYGYGYGGIRPYSMWGGRGYGGWRGGRFYRW
ncbi:hypothetical protein SAMN05444166_4900 [Singulisphaera sp. GP187]|uniref:hypothetical protein n=1 Tax=Singulisphaera sp. GP187 TaxID=1882752 RepID=UPI0009282637|nr:hypothetical protein [Singulisphaera sp. GP187]SIO45834.1 hypothetical protein SAMN05444166_4900 [Singulisphaera sp. GP187]